MAVREVKNHHRSKNIYLGKDYSQKRKIYQTSKILKQDFYKTPTPYKAYHFNSPRQQYSSNRNIILKIFRCLSVWFAVADKPNLKSHTLNTTYQVQAEKKALVRYRKCDFSKCSTKFDYVKEIIACLFSFFDYSIYTEQSEVRRDKRIKLVTWGLIIFIGIILFRLYQIQSTEHHKWQKLAANQQNRSIQIAGVRGAIRDSSGRILATSAQSTSLGAHPKQIKDLEQTVTVLAPLLSIQPAELKEKLNSDKSFIWLARGLPSKLYNAVGDLKLKGIIAIKEFKRYYPHGGLAATVLGKVSRDGKGQSGIEAAYNRYLTADTYNIDVYRDNRGNFVSINNKEQAAKTVSEQDEENQKTIEVRHQGADIILTINAYIQGILEEEFAKAQKQFKAQAVFGIVMDSTTGEILAMAQTPGVNFNQGNIQPEQLVNFSIQSNFEPGSTLKPITAAFALEKKALKLTDVINCENGAYKVADVTIQDVHPLDQATLAEILAYSSNIGMIKIVEKLGKQKFATGLKSFGFGKATGIELYGEEAGIMREAKKWGEVDTAAHAFGQGLSVTALQLMQAYTVIANEGMLVQPFIVKEQGKVNETKRVLKPETANEIFKLLTKVTTDGTGKSAKIEGVKVAGKTGTAQKAKLKGKGYAEGKIFSSYIGIVDARELGIESRLIMFVGVDEPATASRWGGVLAAPVFKKSMERIVSHLLAINTTKNTTNISMIK
ncbi:MAG: penicillin-binding protein 2 [Deltaproteobacteria bacterium]|jgi:cell division protein FtsI (penicillin-binding protein 3)|nr:penicillin-binding protein 2 [Deltaproteobacteria bacterium]